MVNRFLMLNSLLGSNDDNIADKLNDVLSGFNVLTHGFILHNIYFTCCVVLSSAQIGLGDCYVVIVGWKQYALHLYRHF